MKASRHTRVENDASARPPNISSAYVTLIFDLLTPEVDRFTPLSRGRTACANLHPNLLIHFENVVFTDLVKDEGTDGRSNKLTDN